MGMGTRVDRARLAGGGEGRGGQAERDGEGVSHGEHNSNSRSASLPTRGLRSCVLCAALQLTRNMFDHQLETAPIPELNGTHNFQQIGTSHLHCAQHVIVGGTTEHSDVLTFRLACSEDGEIGYDAAGRERIEHRERTESASRGEQSDRDSS